ncbi:MAG: hypothetical protein LIO46_02375, partial [Clostridiales bacterium]|nr:hypothetical protein [Clostridiales bacterium]
VQDELLMKVKVGETVLSPNSPQRAMLLISDFIAKHVPLGSAASASAGGLSGINTGQRLFAPSPAVLAAAPAGAPVSIDSIDCSINVEGNVDQDVLPALEQKIAEMPDKLLNRIIRTHMVKGAGLNARNRSI